MENKSKKVDKAIALVLFLATATNATLFFMSDQNKALLGVAVASCAFAFILSLIKISSK